MGRETSVVDHDPSPLADTEVHRVDATATGDEYRIFVGHCGVRPATTLYLTDANGFFGAAVDTIRLMGIANHLPPMLVIGIGYPVGPLVETIDRRTKDYSPTADAAYGALFPEVPEMGGASATLAFIRDDLMPWVNARYAMPDSDSTLFGHSLAGLFATYALLTAPETFSRYAIASPSLWWDNNLMTSIEQHYAEAHTDLSAKVFFGIGADETYEGRVREAANYPDALRAHATAWPFDMVADMTDLVDRLTARRYPGLDLKTAVFDDEFHVTVGPLALSRALRWLYNAPT